MGCGYNVVCRSRAPYALIVKCTVGRDEGQAFGCGFFDAADDLGGYAHALRDGDDAWGDFGVPC